MTTQRLERKRGFCLTINNWTDNDIKMLEEDNYEYLIIGKETAPKTGTPHLQVYIYYSQAKSFKRMKTRYPLAHIEVAKGTPQQNKDYCSKTGVFDAYGTLPEQGKRTDLETARACLEETGSMASVVLNASSYQSIRVCEAQLKYHEKKRHWKPEVSWYWGPTGTGKSHRAYQELGYDCYTCAGTSRWFEGYDGHPHILIDDMRADFMKFHDLLRFLDKYPYLMECKGGSRQCLARKIIITSAYPPDQLYNKGSEDIRQLLRRIDHIVHCDTPYDTENAPLQNSYDDEASDEEHEDFNN